MTTTTFLMAYGLALLWASGRAVVLYAAGLALVAGTTTRFGRVVARLSRGHAERGAERVRERGALGVARAYLVPGMCEATQLMAGMSRMPLRTFIGGFLLAAIPWAVVDATIGSSILAAITSGWGALALAVGVSVVGYVKRDTVRTRLTHWSVDLGHPVTMAA